MFDVLVYNEKTFQNVVYKSGLTKKQAKNLVAELRQKGMKAQLKSSKGIAATQEIEFNEPEEI